jgi:hypothetical protein
MKILNSISFVLLAVPCYLLGYSHQDYSIFMGKTVLNYYGLNGVIVKNPKKFNTFDLRETIQEELESKKISRENIIEWIRETARELDAKLRNACNALPEHFKEIQKLHYAQKAATPEHEGDCYNFTAVMKAQVRNGAALQKLYKNNKDLSKQYQALCAYELFAHIFFDVSFYDHLSIQGKTFKFFSIGEAIVVRDLNSRSDNELKLALAKLEFFHALLQHHDSLAVPWPLLNYFIIGFSDAPYPHSLDVLLERKKGELYR